MFWVKRMRSLINSLYSESFQYSEKRQYAHNFWGKIPRNIESIGSILTSPPNKETSFLLSQEKIYKLGTLVHQHHKKKLGITRNIKATLKGLPRGIVEGAHQPVLLGGPAFILNKIACTNIIAKVNQLAPIFFVGDYDQIQPELTNIRLPSLGNSGTLLAIPIDEEYQFSPISKIPLPSENWLRVLLDTIDETYSPLLASLPQERRDTLEAHKEHIIHVIRSSYFQTTTIAEWSSKILNSIINEYLGLGIPFLISSTLRPLYQDGFEMLLAKNHREKFIDALNATFTEIQELGYRPGINQRLSNYVPFLYECPNKACHSARTELTATQEGTKLSLLGNCPSCESPIEVVVSEQSPDLSDHIQFLSPRVDTRQVLISSILPIVTHVSGPGETSYYAQVVPAMRAVNLRPPIVFRYLRTYYNSTWNEYQGKELESQGLQGILGPPLFKLLKQWGKSTKKQNTEELQHLQLEIQDWIHTTQNQLNQRIATNSETIEDLKTQFHQEKQDLETLIAQRNQYFRYMTNIYGQYAPEKNGQEVVFSWIDLGIAAGIREAVEFYHRIYSPATPPIGNYFLNLR
jgi:uncharacterized protein YllA (UPF0747 family)